MSDDHSQATPGFTASGAETSPEELASDNAALRRALEQAERQIAANQAGAADAAALQDSEARFRTLADNIAQLAWMADGEGWIFWYNKRWFDYTGTSLSDMAGWGWRSVHHPDHLERVVERFRSSLTSGEAWEDVFPLRGVDGAFRWFLSRALPIRDEDGQIVRWFGTNTDVTAQREAEEQLREADRRKDEYIAMLGHELRNPLAAISNATELIGGFDHNDPVIAQALAVLNRQSNHITKLVDGLLEVTRIARGKIDLELGTLDVFGLVRSVVEDQTQVASRLGIALHVEVPAAPCWVHGDAVRLVQVFENLVSNALKFSLRGDEVRVVAGLQDGDVVVAVQDTGPGISPAMLAEIFQPFVQGEQNVARESGGLGLGLAVARGLVKLHGGTLEAVSPGLGRGATFTVRLTTTNPSQVPGPAQAEKVATKKNVLVVEDNEDAADMLALVLKRRGHQVHVANTAHEGLTALLGQPVDVVVCDLGLPDMSGHDFARAVRKDVAISHVRLVALTGYGQSSDRRESAQAGFDAHLTKPANIEALESAME